MIIHNGLILTKIPMAIMKPELWEIVVRLKVEHLIKALNMVVLTMMEMDGQILRTHSQKKILNG